MDLLDGLIGIVILFGAVLGYRSGILAQALGLAGAGAAVGLIVLLGPLVGQALGHFDQPWRAVLALGGAAVVVVAGDGLGTSLGGALAQRATGTLAAPLDRAGGVLFGAGQGIVICWLVGGLIAGGGIAPLAAQAQRSIALRAILGALPPPSEVIGQLGALLDESGLPDVFIGLEPLPAAPVDLPGSAEAERIGRLAAPSVVRLESEACGRVLVGTGFAVGPGYVVTNAHVVAGANSTTVTVDVGGARLTGRVVFFDPRLDAALLRVPGLELAPLRFATAVPARGAVGAALGHPGGASLTAVPAAVTAAITARGRDLYGEAIVSRDMLELQAAVRPGDSGGPLVLADGSVGGLVFADSRSDPDVGYALSPTAVARDVAPALGATAAVATGPCVA